MWCIYFNHQGLKCSVSVNFSEELSDAAGYETACDFKTKVFDKSWSIDQGKKEANLI